MSVQGGGYGKLGVLTPEGWWFPGVHRLVRECVDGEVNPLHTLHKCSNKLCFNPDHTYSGDAYQNAADRYRLNETTAVGETHKSAKLTASAVSELRERYALGEASQRALAVEYGVNKSTIAAALNGRTWQH